MRTKLTVITPAMASAWLDKTEEAIQAGKFRQRPIREMTVNRYANDIRNGAWIPTHQGIAISDDHLILDGRHRLLAVKKTGVPTAMLVTDDIPTPKQNNGRQVTFMDVIDGGANRSIANQLSISHGLSNANNWTSVANSIAWFVIGSRHVRLTINNILYLTQSVLPAEVEWVVNYGINNQVNKRSILWGQWNTGPLVLYRWAYPNKAKEFADMFYGMEGLERGMPAHQLIQWFTANRARVRTDRLPSMCATANAIRAFHEGEKLEQLRSSAEARSWLLKQSVKVAHTIRNMFRAEADKIELHPEKA